MDKETSHKTTESKNIGPIISTLVIVLILIMAALYIFASHISQQTLPADALMDTGSATTTTVQPVTNNSDDTSSIQSDLKASTKGLNNQNF